MPKPGFPAARAALEPLAHAVGPPVYGVQNFQRPRLVVLYFLVPPILRSARGFDLAAVGKFAWIPFFTAGAGNLLGGVCAARHAQSRDQRDVGRKISVMLFAALMTSAIPAVLVSNVFVSIGLISIATLGYSGALANMLAMPADRFPGNTVGSVWGIASMGAGGGRYSVS